MRWMPKVVRLATLAAVMSVGYFLIGVNLARADGDAKKNAKVEDLASQRAVNTKDYLVTEGGIDPSRITVYTGSGDGKKVEDYLIPSGATFDVTGTTKVADDVKPQPRKALATKHAAHHKKAAK